MKQSTDLEQLRTLCNGDTGRMKRYIGMFLQGTPPALEQLRSDLNTGDLESLARNAHGLKPQAAYMGATALKEGLERLEQAARAGGPTEAAAALDECARIHAAVVNDLNAALDEL
ncbi:MAG TPA: Hpt domain-containing protein [Flavobacteriales bacterium]|nr:Hpt domain-containing protein [Flavobacteriales bacterium]